MADSIHAEARWDGALTAVASARGHEVRVDEPERFGGGDAGMMPTELMLSSLASCFCLAVAHVAGKRDIELPGLRVSVDGERIGRELRYGRLRVEVSAHSGDHDLSALVTRAKPFCWVSNMLSEELDVTYAAVVLPDPTPADAG